MEDFASDASKRVGERECSFSFLAQGSRAGTTHPPLLGGSRAERLLVSSLSYFRYLEQLSRIEGGREIRLIREEDYRRERRRRLRWHHESQDGRCSSVAQLFP